MSRVAGGIDGLEPVFDDGSLLAQVAETTVTTSARSRSRKPRTLRLIVRRTRLVGAQAELWPNWRHHAFITDRDDLDTKGADAYHRAHARVELAIKDLKDNGLRRCPSGRFFANGAWSSPSPTSSARRRTRRPVASRTGGRCPRPRSPSRSRWSSP